MATFFETFLAMITAEALTGSDGDLLRSAFVGGLASVLALLKTVMKNYNAKNNDPSNFTQKELILMILDRLDDMDEKISSLLEDKVSRKEFYSVLGVLMTFGLILVALV